MNYITFRKELESFPLFETKELRVIFGSRYSPTTMLVNLRNWMKKGYITPLRRGLYVFADRTEEIGPMAFSTKLYTPSYVSMEAALGFYGIIPEAVFTVTAVTTRKTKSFKTPLGNFSYQKIKREAFGGYETKENRVASFKIAVPEKAIADFLYLNHRVLNGDPEQFRGYRFNEDFVFDRKKILTFVSAFGNKKTKFLAEKFIELYASK